MDHVYRELHRTFGSEITLRAVKKESVDLDTGQILKNEDVRTIKAIVLPNYMKYQRMSGLSGGLMVNERSVLTQSDVGYDDTLFFEDKTWQVTEIDTIMGTKELTVKEIERGS